MQQQGHAATVQWFAIALTSAGEELKSVIESTSTALPPYEWHNASRRTTDVRRSFKSFVLRVCAIVYV